MISVRAVAAARASRITTTIAPSIAFGPLHHPHDARSIALIQIFLFRQRRLDPAMPRPKRTKVASTTTTTTRVAGSLDIAASAPRQQQKTKKASDRVESFSDDSDGLVVKSQRVQRRMPWHLESRSDADFTMTGALPIQDEGLTIRASGKQGSPRVKSPSRSRLTPSSDRSKRARKSNSSTNTPSHERSPIEVRPAVTSTFYGTPLEEDGNTGFGDNLLTFTSLDSESPAHGTCPPSARKVGATPAHETSILALTNFKRRARQPSLLRMVHQNTDVEDNDLDELNNFSDLDDLDDFRPEHESTPLHVYKSPHESTDENDSGLRLTSSGSRGKKCKLSSPVIQVPRSSPIYDPPSGADITESRATSPSLPDNVVESREEVVGTQEVQPEIMSDTMAPPQSSSPPANETEDPPDSPTQSRQGRARGRHRIMGRNRTSNRHELNGSAKLKYKNTPKAYHGISTAKLQSLLPKRRTRVLEERDEYDVEDSDEPNTTPLDSDEDELQMPHPRHTVPSRKGADSKSNKKAARAVRKTAPIAKPNKKTARTYGRRTSDKENEGVLVADDGEDITQPSVVVPGSQLAAIAKQFEDVDAWEMDFESAGANGDNSSPWR